MVKLTIRNLDDSPKARLRASAASHNRSIEEEARQVLRAALDEPAAPIEDLGARIRARFAGLGDVQSAPETREPMRSPPTFVTLERLVTNSIARSCRAITRDPRDRGCVSAKAG
jgi:plasmid stability protein